MITKTAVASVERKSRFHLTEYRREYISFLLFALPNLILLAIWTFWPFFHSLFLSITNWNLLKPEYDIVGLSNYVRLMQSRVFWQITRNTLVYSFGTVFIRLLISMVLAVLLNQRIPARGFWRLVIFSPHITTAAAMALVWNSMYAEKYGLFASVFQLLGAKFPRVLSDVRYVLPAVMLVGIWKSLGFSTVVILAALQGVDTTLKEAAAIDGASAWQSFWNVSFPTISPMIYFLIVTGLMGAMRTFAVVRVMTGGGPANASNLFVLQIYREAFSFQRMGYASAIAVLMFLIVMVFTYAQNRLKDRWVNY